MAKKETNAQVKKLSREYDAIAREREGLARHLNQVHALLQQTNHAQTATALKLLRSSVDVAAKERDALKTHIDALHATLADDAVKAAAKAAERARALASGATGPGGLTREERLAQTLTKGRIKPEALAELNKRMLPDGPMARVWSKKKKDEWVEQQQKQAFKDAFGEPKKRTKKQVLEYVTVLDKSVREYAERQKKARELERNPPPLEPTAGSPKKKLLSKQDLRASADRLTTSMAKPKTPKVVLDSKPSFKVGKPANPESYVPPPKTPRSVSKPASRAPSRPASRGKSRPQSAK